jgi:hypothetical protein
MAHPLIGRTDRCEPSNVSACQVQAASADRGDSGVPDQGSQLFGKRSHTRRAAAAMAGALAPVPASRASMRRNTRCRMLSLVMG